MKKNYIEIACILDRSGSMITIKDDAIGGFNQFLNDQQKVEGEAKLTLVLFDDQYEKLYDSVNIQYVNPLNNTTFVPRGWTALNDAIGKTINSLGEKLAKMNEEDRPEKVLFVILTDGQENNSKEFTQHQISEMISHQREKYNWEFIFLAANQDAILTAQTYSIPKGNSLNFTADSFGVRGVYDKISSATTAYRSAVNIDSANLFDDNKNQ